MKLTVGSDIEFFVSSAQSTHPKSLVTGALVCPNPKDEPMALKYGKMHWDNILLEVCPNHAETEEEFVKNVVEMRDNAANKSKNLGCQLTPLSAAYVSHDLAHSDNGLCFGCDPDMNAYTRTLQRPKINPSDTLRTAGGHVHIGTEAKTIQDQVALAKLCDLYLGVPSVLLDKDTTRRRMYGKAGSFRPKPYGIEYRVLSNFWAFSERHIAWVYNQVEEVVEFYTQMREDLSSGGDKADWQWLLSPEIGEECSRIINEHDVRKARSHVKFSNVAMP